VRGFAAVAHGGVEDVEQDRLRYVPQSLGALAEPDCPKAERPVSSDATNHNNCQEIGLDSPHSAEERTENLETLRVIHHIDELKLRISLHNVGFFLCVIGEHERGEQ